MDRGEVFSPAEKQGQRFQIQRKRHGRMVKQRKKSSLFYYYIGIYIQCICETNLLIGAVQEFKVQYRIIYEYCKVLFQCTQDSKRLYITEVFHSFMHGSTGHLSWDHEHLLSKLHSIINLQQHPRQI
jgi:hypothetical protein